MKTNLRKLAESVVTNGNNNIPYAQMMYTPLQGHSLYMITVPLHYYKIQNWNKRPIDETLPLAFLLRNYRDKIYLIKISRYGGYEVLLEMNRYKNIQAHTWRLVKAIHKTLNKEWFKRG